MRYIFCLLFIFPFTLWAQETLSSLLYEADEAYHREDFSLAVEIYERVLENQRQSIPAVYFNLGNSYYYQGKRPEALWAYEQAQSLSPWNRSIVENILAVEMELPFNPVHPEKSNPEKWIFWYSLLPPLLWQIMLWCSLFTLSLLATIFLIKRKKNGFTIGLLIVFSLFSSLPLLVNGYLNQHPYGRIMIESHVYSGNGEFYEKVQRTPLQPGQKIRILETRRDWALMEWGPEKRGWIKLSGIRTIGK